MRLEKQLLNCILEERETVKLTTSFDSYHRLLVHKLADFYGFDRIVSKPPGSEQNKGNEKGNEKGDKGIEKGQKGEKGADKKDAEAEVGRVFHYRDCSMMM